jgi:hypothetical protein
MKKEAVREFPDMREDICWKKTIEKTKKEKDRLNFQKW